VTISDDYHCAEGKPPAAFDNLGYTTKMYHSVFEFTFYS
jgi:hypothetical protein